MSRAPPQAPRPRSAPASAAPRAPCSTRDAAPAHVGPCPQRSLASYAARALTDASSASEASFSPGPVPPPDAVSASAQPPSAPRLEAAAPGEAAGPRRRLYESLAGSGESEGSW
jgi:hypothetical protein